MKCLDLTLPTPAENLACDEALLDLAEEGAGGEVLRFWEPAGPFVVVGYANKAAREVNLEACQADGVGVFRRCTGGGTVLQGPGCLNYSLIVRIDGAYTFADGHQGFPFHSIATTNQFILQRHRDVVAALLNRPVRVCGDIDLATGNRKFSGNAQRRHRKFLIFHGTFLLNLNLDLVSKYLQMPSKQPDYREHRSHAEFLTNLNLSTADVKKALQDAWDANEPLIEIPNQRIAELVRTKYATNEWNEKF